MRDGAVDRKALQARFERIRRAYFPRWDRKREWSFTSDSRGLMGCASDNTIAVAVSPESSEFDETVIHEIAHATTSCGHGRRWQQRMKAAAKRATELGETELAAALVEDADYYRKHPDLPKKQEVVKSAYLDILTDLPEASFETATALLTEVLNWTRGKVWRLEKHLPRLYEIARLEHDEARRAHEENLARLAALGRV